MKTPNVSILIPVYNRENFIAACIESALSQTFSNIEVIVVDNASTDRTWDVCKHYAAIDSRVRIFRNDENVGPVRNWLRCAAEARGAYGKMLFSDDLMFPHFLEKTLPYLEDADVAFVSTSALLGETPATGVVLYNNMPRGAQRVSSEQYFNFLIPNKRFQIPYSPGAAIFRMADIRANLRISIQTKNIHDFTKNGAGPDVLLFALTTLNYKNVVMLSQTEVFFRVHQGSFTILDSGNEVTQGYRIAIAWFCKNKLSKRHWARYVARAWLSDMKKTRSLISPNKYAASYEGEGTAGEVGAIILSAFSILISPLKLFAEKI